MKQRFTLFTVLVLSYLSGFSQINQTFETVSSLQALTNNCWEFSGIAFSNQGNVHGANHLTVLPTTSNSSYASIATAYVNLTAGSPISFSYKLGNDLVGNATRTITAKLQSLDGSFTTLGSITLDKFTPVSVQSISFNSPVTGVRKIVIEINGTADGNSDIFLDDLSVGGTFNYNTPYGCNTRSNIPLPVKLTAFDGLLVSGKTLLQWAVAENEAGEYFEIEKSEGGAKYKNIGLVFTTDRKGTENYLFKDPQAVTGTTLYRLKMVSKKGEIEYSKVLVMKPDQTLDVKTLTLLQNPVINNLIFTMKADQTGFCVLSIYNMNGVKVYGGTLNVQKGSNVFNLAIDTRLTTGSYILETIENTNRSTVKFIKL